MGVMLSRKESMEGGDWNALVPSFAGPLSEAAPLRVSARDGKAWRLDFCPENKCLPAE